MSILRKILALAAFALASSFAPRTAVAADTLDILTVGYLHSWRYREASRSGNGVEVSYAGYQHIPVRVRGLGLGGFAHFEVTNQDQLELSLGPQVNFHVLGVEAGFEHVSRGATPAASNGCYLGTFLSLGMFALGWHAVIPVGKGDGSPGYRHALTFAFKLPILIKGNDWALFHSGLP